MTRSRIETKARRLLTTGHVFVTRVDGAGVEAVVLGDHDVYLVTHDRRRWRCSCPSPSACSHAIAVALVAVAVPAREESSGWTPHRKSSDRARSLDPLGRAFASPIRSEVREHG